MSKKINELSKKELESLIYNNFNVSLIDLAYCAVCSSSADKKWYYVCEKCNEALENG